MRITTAIRVVDAEHQVGRWVATEVTTNPKMQREIRELFTKHGVDSVAVSEGNGNSSHEASDDIPDGEDCPFCPFWRGEQRSNRQVGRLDDSTGGCER